MKGSAFILGLTGSIGTGKTTTAAMFADAGAMIWSADEAVARLYSPGGGAENAVGQLCPEAVRECGSGVDKTVLRSRLAAEPGLLKRLEDIVHPLVARDRESFIQDANRDGADLIVLEIPLLFETGARDQFDAIAVVSVPADEQRRRVLGRGTMSEQQFDSLLTRQMPDAEKRNLADYVIETTSFEKASEGVRGVLEEIKEKIWQGKS